MREMKMVTREKGHYSYLPSVVIDWSHYFKFYLHKFTWIIPKWLHPLLFFFCIWFSLYCRNWIGNIIPLDLKWIVWDLVKQWVRLGWGWQGEWLARWRSKIRNRNSKSIYFTQWGRVRVWRRMEKRSRVLRIS